MNEYYSKDLSKKVETGKHSIWAQGGFSEGTPPYGYYRATDGSRKLLIDEEVSDNVVSNFNMFWMGRDMLVLQRLCNTKEFFHLRNTDSISQERLNLLKSKRMALFACKRDTPRGILHWKYCSWKAKEGS